MPVSLWFCTEKVPGEGEDSDPLLMIGFERALLGAFDGMGGAGGTLYETPGGRHSGAWFASRLARDVVSGHLPEVVGAGPEIDGALAAQSLAGRLRAALAQRLSEFSAPPTALRSRLLRALPTTMAVAYLIRTEPGGTGGDPAYACHCFWAGDSRVYVVDPVSGAHQLTTDDLRSGGDALANLVDDAVMDNCLSADTEFTVHHRRVDLRAPFIAVAATDGCFGYVPSPMHFEHLILATLDEADSVDAWREALRSRVESVAGDDASLALLAVGGGIDDLRTMFRERLGALRRTYIDPIDEVERQTRDVEREAGALKQRRMTLRSELWARYKPDYERHLSPVAGEPVPAPASGEEPVAHLASGEPASSDERRTS